MDDSVLLAPTEATLAKHGLDLDLWYEIALRQDFVCGACGTLPKNQRLNIDHEHVRGYYNMDPEDQRKYHRGLLCHMCNRYRLARGASVANLRGAADYLERYERRRDADS